MDSLLKNDTYELVELPKGRKNIKKQVVVQIEKRRQHDKVQGSFGCQRFWSKEKS